MQGGMWFGWSGEIADEAAASVQATQRRTDHPPYLRMNELFAQALARLVQLHSIARWR
jgi:hypothetical protein